MTRRWPPASWWKGARAEAAPVTSSTEPDQDRGRAPFSLPEWWHSARFWQGIVAGMAAAYLIKLILFLGAPYGIDWYG